jgi:acetamidase/formamidase
MGRLSFSPSHYHSTLGAHPPVLEVSDGDVITAETIDAHGFDKDMQARGPARNPMTGPFFVKGVQPGDVLAIDIIRIGLNRKTGWTRSGLAWNVVDPAAVRDMPEREKVIWDIGANGVSLQQPPAALAQWSTGLAPMVGCLGVCPAHGEFISSTSSGPHGGNMDYRRIAVGTTLFLPVAVEGALFFIGDLHAAQGDGEIAGTGIETSGEVEFRLRRIAACPQGWPRGETADYIFTIGNARPLEQALQHATTEMLAWLSQDHGLDRLSASHLLAMHVRYDIANVFNPAFSVACRLDKSVVAPFRRAP